MQFKFTSLLLLVLTFAGLGKLNAQCTLDCPPEMDVILPESGNIELGLMDVLDSLPAACPAADSLVLVPNELNCTFAGSATPYQIQHARTGEALCTGVLNVKDTTEQELICRENVTIFLPEDESFRRMIQADYVFAIRDNCDRTGIFNYFPKAVDCSMVGEEVTYAVLATGSQDTLCTGNVTVLDTTSTEIKCVERFDIELSANGFPSFIFPSDVIAEGGTDNCQRLNNLNISPVLYNCSMAGENVYTVKDRETGDTICSGIVYVRDTILPQVECVDTLQIYLPNNGAKVGVAPGDLVTMFSDNCGTVDNLQVFPVDSFDCESLDSAITYELVPRGAEAVVCSGTIEVIDTFSRSVQCEENVIVSLPLTYDGFRLSPDIFIKEDVFSCNGVSSLKTFPEAVYCYNAGEELEYLVSNKFTGDTVCVGTLKVEDAGEPAITCTDTFQISLPSSGRPYQLDWRDVVRSFSDNCISILDLEVSPRFVDCADAGQSINYSVSTRSSDDVLCNGVVEVIDETPLEMTCAEVVEVQISPSGFPGILFPSRVIGNITDNCTRQTDFRITPTFFFCPDSSATYTLIDRRTNEVACTGQVIVTGEPSPFGNCEDLNSAEGKTAAGLVHEIAPLDRSALRLFPNPTQQDQIQVQLPEQIEGEVQYRITNLLGASQKTGTLDYQGGAIPLSLNGLPAGTYLFVLEGADGQRMTKRFVKTQ